MAHIYLEKDTGRIDGIEFLERNDGKVQDENVNTFLVGRVEADSEYYAIPLPWETPLVGFYGSRDDN